MADSAVALLAASDALTGVELFYADGLASAAAADVKVTAAKIKTFCSASPTLVTPALGVAAGTSLALGGATLGSNALAVTGTGFISGNLTLGDGTSATYTLSSNLSGITDPSISFSNNFVALTNGGAGLGVASSYTIISANSPIGWGTSGTLTNSSTLDTTLSRNAAGVTQFGTTAANAAGIGLAASFQTTDNTVSGLPAAAAGNKGQRRHVTDANATTFGTTAAGGGSNIVPVFSTGAAWIIA